MPMCKYVFVLYLLFLKQDKHLSNKNYFKVLKIIEEQMENKSQEMPADFLVRRLKENADV